MSSERAQLLTGIAALEAQRDVLGEDVAEAALGRLRAKLSRLSSDAAASPPIEQALKQVSILFADAVGSTALVHQLDPEEADGVMNGALERWTRVVQDHQGTVLQYAGDSVLAVFGAEAAREDDAERAVRAGLAICAETRGLDDSPGGRGPGVALGVRVGVHTGAVLLGAGVDHRSSIRGDAVNVAARMEQSAPAGGLRISHDTYCHVRGVFDVQPQAPLLFKGLPDPLVTYLVLRAKPRAFRVATRGIENIETRMVGRDAEIELAQQAFFRLRDERRLVTLTVVGEAGLGKSRLLYEFENWAETRPERFYLFQGRAYPQTRAQPYGLLRDVVARRLQVDDGDSMEVAKRKVEDGIVPLFEPDEGQVMARGHAHLLGHLIGLDFGDSSHVAGIVDDPRQIRNRGFHAAAQWLRRLAASGDAPLVMQLEDLHWADDGSLDFLRYLVQVARDVPMLIVAMMRPWPIERPLGWQGAPGSHRCIELAPLDKSASRVLAGELLKKLPELPAALRELVAASAEGNPFYMEELVKMFVDRGALRTGPERWSLDPTRLLQTPVPPTLTGVLQARLDSLPAAEKLALQQASIVGSTFWDGALAAIDARAGAVLPLLLQRGLVTSRADASLDGDGVREYAFAHHLLHQVTYDTVLKRVRREGHARAADWLASMQGARAHDFLGKCAEHYREAGDPEAACEFFARAAEHARTRYAHEAALDHVTNALAHLGPDDGDLAKAGQRWRVLDVRERTFDLLGSRESQAADLEALQRLAVTMQDDRRRAELALRRCHLAMRRYDAEAQDIAAREAMTLAARAGDDEMRLNAQRLLAIAHAYLDRRDRSRELALQGLAEAQALGMRRAEGRFLNALSVLHSRNDELVARVEANLRHLAIQRELGDLRTEAIALGNVGSSWLELGAFDEARTHLEAALKLHRSVGDRSSEAYVLAALSELALATGDDALALTQGVAAQQAAAGAQAPMWEARAWLAVGNAEMAFGRTTAAEAAYARMLDIENSRAQRHDALAGLARTALARDDPAAALAHLRPTLAVASVEGLAGTQDRRAVLLTCWRVLARLGDPRAGPLLEKTHAELLALATLIDGAAARRRFLDIPAHRDIVAAWTGAARIEAVSGPA